MVTTWADLRADIARAKVTQRALAERLGIAPSLLSTYLNTADVEPTEAFARAVREAIEELKELTR